MRKPSWLGAMSLAAVLVMTSCGTDDGTSTEAIDPDAVAEADTNGVTITLLTTTRSW